MARSSAELTVQQANTTAFIAVDPVDIPLTRHPRTPNGAGGYRLGAPVAVASQRFRLILQTGRQGDTGERALLDSVVQQVTHDLIGAADANVEPGDKFTIGGQNYEVVEVYSIGGYETRARVTTRA